MTSFWRRFLHGCLVEHGDMFRERVHGRYQIRCDRCGMVVRYPKGKLRVKPSSAKVTAFRQRKAV